ncbi:MAG: hypothetical protein ACE5G1_17635 [bacterium]
MGKTILAKIFSNVYFDLEIYWRDTGRLRALLNVSDVNNLLSQPWVGFSWESLVIEQIA